MIEIRTFEGRAEDLSTLSKDVFSKTYAGIHPAPLYSKETFERDLLADGRYPDLILVAYDGARLVGMHPAKPLSVRIHGKDRVAAWGSYLAVLPEYRKRGVAFRLHAEYVKRHLDHGLDVSFGFTWDRSALYLGPTFWGAQPRNSVQRIAHLGSWMRALDHAAVVEFEIFRRDAWGARAMSTYQGKPRRPEDYSGIRDYRPSDLGQCVALMNSVGRTTDLAYVWDETTAARLLAFPNLSCALVLEDGSGNVCGLVSFTFLEVLGKNLMRSARIDTVDFDAAVSRRDRRRLLRAALFSMSQDGAKGCFLLRGTWDYWRDFVATGFVPTPPEYTYVALTLKERLPLGGVHRLAVLLI